MRVPFLDHATKSWTKKSGCIEMQPPGINSRQCRFAGIPNHEVQVGHSQFNFGLIGLATLTPIELYSATYAHKWFKEYMAMANTAGVAKHTLMGCHVKLFGGKCRRL
jgi:hypothetical protein